MVLRGRERSRFTLGLVARADGDTIRLDVAGDGGLAPLAPWLPAALAQARKAEPASVRAQIGLSPGDRAAGRMSARLGDVASVEGALSFQDKRLRMSELRGTSDLALAAPVAGLAGPVTGRAELADGEVTWTPERGGWPEGRVTLHVLDAALPAATVGSDVRARGLEVKLTLEPREGAAGVRGELRGERLEVAGLALAPVATPFQVDLGPGGSPARVELTGLTAQALGTPLRGTATYDVARARVDARVETGAGRLDALARHFGGDFLGPVRRAARREPARSRHGARREGLDRREGGRGGAERRPATTRWSGRPCSARTSRRPCVPGPPPSRTRPRAFAALCPPSRGLSIASRAPPTSVATGAARASRGATMVGRDAQGREMLQARPRTPASTGAGGPIRLTAKLPALDRLAPLWPSVTAPGQRVGDGRARVAGSRDSAPTRGASACRSPTAELLGRPPLGLRDVSGDVPVRRGNETRQPAVRAPQGGRARGLRRRALRPRGARSGRRPADHAHRSPLRALLGRGRRNHRRRAGRQRARP